MATGKGVRGDEVSYFTFVDVVIADVDLQYVSRSVYFHFIYQAKGAIAMQSLLYPQKSSRAATYQTAIQLAVTY